MKWKDNIQFEIKIDSNTPINTLIYVDGQKVIQETEDNLQRTIYTD